MREEIKNKYTNIIREIQKNDSLTHDAWEETQKFIGFVKETADDEEKQILIQDIHRLIEKSKVDRAIFFYSMILEIRHDADIMNELILYVTDSENLDYSNLHFLFYQFERMVFLNPEYETETVLTAKWKLLKELTDIVKKKISLPLTRLKKETLNNDLVVVLTEQFLNTGHGPTKTTLDRCVVLKRDMNKEVFLINTAEFMSVKGLLPMIGASQANYNPALCKQEEQFWKEIRIPFFQCDNTMPDIEVYEILLQTIFKLRPSMVIQIGGASVLAGLVNEMVPVLTVGTTQSGLSAVVTDYQTVHGQIDKKWFHVLEEVGKDRNYLIEGRFTFSLKEQKEKTSRMREKIPENQFLLAVVGGRLDEEVKEDFLVMLEDVLSDKTGIVFIGKFNTFSEWKKRYSKIGDNMYYLGMCEDVLSKLEICDLYVNPTRKGGATSAVEAMSKGKPVITVNYGDVAGVAGKEFCCRDYVQMAEEIKRYQEDSEFYNQRSAASQRLAEQYLDSSTEFVRIVKEYEKRMQES